MKKLMNTSTNFISRLIYNQLSKTEMIISGITILLISILILHIAGPNDLLNKR